MSTATAYQNASPLLSNAPLGEVSTNADGVQVVFHRQYRASPERVWAALTTPERLADWLATAVVDLRVGGTIKLDWGGQNRADVTIIVCDPPRSLAWVWPLGGRDTLVRFELAAEAGGCALTLTHTGITAASGGVRRGWHAHLEAIPDALQGRATPWAVKTAREEAIAPAYPKLVD
jgi:uncharacterized protein YndB with AHSA1/START domain